MSAETVEQVIIDHADDTSTVEPEGSPTETELADGEGHAAFVDGYEGHELASAHEPEADEPPETTEAGADQPKAESVHVSDPTPTMVAITEAELAQLRASAAEVATVKDAMERQFGAAYGKMGGIERTLKELQSATPSGQPVEVTDADFQELQEEFPELAKMTMAGLNRALSRVKGTAPGPSAIDPAQIQQIVDERLAQEQEVHAQKVMTWLEPNWREIVGGQYSNSAYRQWLAAQPSEYQQQMMSEMDPYAVHASIKKFRQSTAPAPPSAAPQKAQRMQQLKAAVPSKGVAGTHTVTTPSEIDEFYNGYNTG